VEAEILVCSSQVLQKLSAEAIIGTPKIYTTTGFGPRKNREMAVVGDLVVYMQNAVKYSSLYIHHPSGGVYLWGPNIKSKSQIESTGDPEKTMDFWPQAARKYNVMWTNSRKDNMDQI